jgi:hypothetical protein
MAGSVSRDKGQRAERAAIKLLQPVVNEVYAKHGRDAPVLQRNQLQSHLGGEDISGIRWCSIEIKHQEALSVEAWWAQCVKQCKGIREPILLYKQNNIKWRVRIWAAIVVHGSTDTQWHVIEMGANEFLIYFEARLTIEVQKEIANEEREAGGFAF